MRTVAAVVLIAAGAGVDAHHAISAIYDGGRNVTLDGIVREFKLVNPHPWVEVTVVDGAGRDRAWRLEMDNLFELTAIGVTADTLKPGDRVTVTGSPARDRSDSLYVRRLDRPADGFRYEQVGTSPRIRAPR